MPDYADPNERIRAGIPGRHTWNVLLSYKNQDYEFPVFGLAVAAELNALTEKFDDVEAVITSAKSRELFAHISHDLARTAMAEIAFEVTKSAGSILRRRNFAWQLESADLVYRVGYPVHYSSGSQSIVREMYGLGPVTTAA